jgi:hypothetical protein
MSDQARRAAPPRQGGAWHPALAVVVLLYALTLPLTWLFTDQAEMLLSARRLVEQATLTLADDGSRPVEAAPWAPRRAGEPVRSRLHPGTPIVLAPLLLLDKALGLDDPANLGTLAHLQGLVFTSAAFAVAGAALAGLGVGAASIAMALLLAGCSWPAWQMARNGGSEPILALLLAAHVAAGALANHAREPWHLIAPRVLALVLLPWVHPTGAVLAVALALAALPPRGTRRVGAALLGAAAAGCLSVALVWNLGFHGSLVAGGYTLVGGERFFGATNPALGLLRMLRAFALLAPFPLALLVLAVRRMPDLRRAELRDPLVMLGALLLLFASYYQHDTARRFSIVLPSLVLPMALAADEVRWRFPARHVIVGLGLVVGSAWFVREAGHYYPGPDGLFYPSVVWVKLAIDRGLSAAWGLPVACLVAALCVAWLHTSRTLAGSVARTP